MKVDIAVCGLAHYKGFIEYISKAGLLNKFYYSHKLSTNHQKLGILPSEATNLFPKEYLIHLYGRIFRSKFRRLKDIFALIWQLQLLNHAQKHCDILDFAMHGTFLYALKRLGSNYKKFIGHPLTAHPFTKRKIIMTEAQKRGLKVPALQKDEIRMAKEQNYCDFLHVASTYVKNSYISNGFPAEKIQVIPYGAKQGLFFPKNKQNNTNKFTVLCVGNISLLKGQLYLLEAWKKLNLPNSELILVGKLTSNIIPLLDKYRNSYTHYPFIPHNKLVNLYNSADVFVLPSLNDGFGLVVAEAINCGLPVIVTSNTGAADIVNNGNNGFIIPASSSEIIAEKISFFYNNRKIGIEIKQNSLLNTNKQLKWEDYTDLLIKFYTEVLQS
jgi:glycosyltransferase involved in cell wall biosynthesis